MAIVPLTPLDILSSGTTTAYTGSLSTSDTYTFRCDPRVFLHFKKTGAGACTVTVVTPNKIDDLAITDGTSGVAATTGETMIGPFRSEVYADPATGLVSFSCSEITGLSVAVVRVQ